MDKSLAKKLIQLLFASWICGSILQHVFGAPDWILWFCAIGMGLFWIEEKTVDRQSN